MFKFLPPTALPGFRVGLADDDTPGFNVPTDGPTSPVLPGAADAPTVDDSYPFGATSFSFNVTTSDRPQSGCAYSASDRRRRWQANQTPTDPTPSAGSLPT